VRLGGSVAGIIAVIVCVSAANAQPEPCRFMTMWASLSPLTSTGYAGEGGVVCYDEYTNQYAGLFSAKAWVLDTTIDVTVAEANHPLCTGGSCYGDTSWVGSLGGSFSDRGHCYRTRTTASSAFYSNEVGSAQQCDPGISEPPGGGGPPQTCHTCGGVIEPLALDLDGNGLINTTGLSQIVHFDIDADGQAEWITWLDPDAGDGFLWLDIDPNHRVDSGFELFGIGMTLPSGRRASSGFEALAAYDTTELGGNEDGMITTADHVWGRLRLWVDANLDGAAQPREISTIAQQGIRSISLQYVAGDDVDSNGNDHHFRSLFKRSSGGEEELLPIHGLIFQAAH